MSHVLHHSDVKRSQFDFVLKDGLKIYEVLQFVIIECFYWIQEMDFTQLAMKDSLLQRFEELREWPDEDKFHLLIHYCNVFLVLTFGQTAPLLRPMLKQH